MPGPGKRCARNGRREDVGTRERKAAKHSWKTSRANVADLSKVVMSPCATMQTVLHIVLVDHSYLEWSKLELCIVLGSEVILKMVSRGTSSSLLCHINLICCSLLLVLMETEYTFQSASLEPPLRPPLQSPLEPAL